MVKILIVGEYAPSRERIRIRLLRNKNVIVVGECNNDKEALGLIPELTPDLIIFDVRLPYFYGSESLEKIRKSGIEVIISICTNDPFPILKNELLPKELIKYYNN
jgi:DNA-binding NarL/FixJ family response regulator